MIHASSLSCTLPTGEELFVDVSFTVQAKQKVALVGNNGVGKSTLLGLLAGTDIWTVPQNFGQFDDMSVAQALGIEGKIAALRAITAGSVNEKDYDTLADDWEIEERTARALAHWGLSALDPARRLGTLSSGQKTKVFLAGIEISKAENVLLDEPTNHLDITARKNLYDLISSSSAAMLVVSHDKKLLSLCQRTLELSKIGVKEYGGNYDFYEAQKTAETNALIAEVDEKTKELKAAKNVLRAAVERKQRLDARGKQKQVKAGTGGAEMNFFKDKSEKSSARLSGNLEAKSDRLYDELKDLEKELPNSADMKLNLDRSALHNGKLLISARDVNFRYRENSEIWDRAQNLEIYSGDRLRIQGDNGWGKSTLINLLLGVLKPTSGEVKTSENLRYVYVDQNYSLINVAPSVLEVAQKFNASPIPDSEVKIILARFLFKANVWNRKIENLSGGERVRLALACLSITKRAPDLIVLDEPTNNLDIVNTEILQNAVSDFAGTLLVVTHDDEFADKIRLQDMLIR